MLLLAAAEVTLWPDATPTPYRTKLGDAVGALARCLDAVADMWSGRPEGGERFAAALPAATDAAEALRPSRLPPGLRPASAGRRDRALASAAGSARLLLGRTVDLSLVDDHCAVTLPAAAALLRQTASCADAAAAWLRGEAEEVPDTDRIAAALDEFRAARDATSPDGLPPERLQLGSLALSLGEWTKSMVAAIRVAAGAPIPPDHTPASAQPGPLWFAYRSTAGLWWHRMREHLTPRSVYFQGALRLALALAVARLLAGVFDLSHGFWVLLTVLTLLRTSAADTRSTLRPALVGTTAGALVAAVVLVVGLPPTVYAIALPVVMLVGFAAGPLLGPGWAQALFTLVIAFVFAQVSPVDWRLAEARIVDVVIGAGIGVLIGLLAWPRGGSGELHRATGTFLAAAADVVRETVGVLARDAAQGGALPRARRGGHARRGLLRAVPDRAPPACGHRLAGHPRGGPPRGARRRGAPARLPDGLPAAVSGAADHGRRGRRRPLRAGRRPVCSTATAGPPPRCRSARRSTGRPTSACSCTRSPTCACGSTACATTSAASRASPRTTTCAPASPTSPTARANR